MNNCTCRNKIFCIPRSPKWRRIIILATHTGVLSAVSFKICQETRADTLIDRDTPKERMKNNRSLWSRMKLEHDIPSLFPFIRRHRREHNKCWFRLRNCCPSNSVLFPASDALASAQTPSQPASRNSVFLFKLPMESNIFDIINLSIDWNARGRAAAFFLPFSLFKRRAHVHARAVYAFRRAEKWLQLKE